MTHGFVLEFESQEDLDYYILQEPVHVRFSKDAGPLIEDSVVVDNRDGVLFGPPAKRPIGHGEYIGSCHCGDTTRTAKLSTAEHVLCHCATCQKPGGGPYSCNQIIPKEDIKITSGTPKITYTGASGFDVEMEDKRRRNWRKIGLKMIPPTDADEHTGKAVRCFFCGTCTSHIYHHQDVMPDKIIVRNFLLEGGPQMPATGREELVRKCAV